MDREGIEFHKLAKKERGQYQAILTIQTWSIYKGFIIWLSGKFFLRDAVGSLERARGSILLVRVTTYSVGHMLKLRHVAEFERKLEKHQLSSTFSDQLFCARFAKTL